MEGHARNDPSWHNRQQPVSYQDLDDERVPRGDDNRYYADGGRSDHYERPQYNDRNRYEGTSYQHQRRRSRSPDYRPPRQYPHDAYPDDQAHDSYRHQDPYGRMARYNDRDYERDPYHQPRRRSRSPPWDRSQGRDEHPYADHDWRADQERDSRHWEPGRDRRDYERPHPKYEPERDGREIPRRTPPPPPPPKPPGPRYVPAQLRLVKLTSDVLPAQQSVATVESEAYGGSGSVGVEEGISVGRDRVFTRRLRLASMDVSKHHANIFRTAGAPTSLGGEGGWWIVDQGSAHGTYVLRADKRLDFFKGESDDRSTQDAMALQQITTSHPPLSAYHRLSEPKTASRPYELRHQDLVRFGATVLEVHLHVAPSSDDRAVDGIDYRAATCCEVYQIDFSGQNLIPLSAKEGGGSTSTSNSQSDLASTSIGGGGGDTSTASGTDVNRSTTGDRKVDSEVEWKRQMKGLRANYLGGSGKTKGKAGAGSEAAGGAGSTPSASTASWKKHLSTKKKRSNAGGDDSVMVSISTAHLERQYASQPTEEAAAAGMEPKQGGPSNATGTVEPNADPSGASTSASVPQYVDRAAQRRLHAHSIEKTLPRTAVAELTGNPHRVDPQQAARLASAVLPLPRSVDATTNAEPVIRASASKPLAETNRGFKLLSAMAGGGGGGGSSGAVEGGEGVSGGAGQGDGPSAGRELERQEREGARDVNYDPILARGTSGRAGLGSAKLRDVDEIAAAGQSEAARYGSSYAEHGRETMKRRWDEARS